MPPRPIDDGTLILGDLVLCDLDAAARRLHLSSRSVRRLVRDGAIASILHGGRRMISESEIHDYVARQLADGARQRAARARAHRGNDRSPSAA